MRAPAVREAARKMTWRPWADGEHKLLTRYVLVSGVFGLPASIVQLQVMLWIYQVFFGDYNWLSLNILWIVNFELGLTRNFLLHCTFTWGTNPSWKRYAHVHIAAIGAFIIDIIAFNLVLTLTNIILVAQVFGAASGFLCNFLYNRFRTFGDPRGANEEQLPEAIA